MEPYPEKKGKFIILFTHIIHKEDHGRMKEEKKSIVVVVVVVPQKHRKYGAYRVMCMAFHRHRHYSPPTKGEGGKQKLTQTWPEFRAPGNRSVWAVDLFRPS